jgi:hypothetical protein
MKATVHRAVALLTTLGTIITLALAGGAGFKGW